MGVPSGAGGLERSTGSGAAAAAAGAAATTSSVSASARITGRKSGRPLPQTEGKVCPTRASALAMTPRALLAPGRLAGQPILRTQSDERLVDLVRAGSDPAFEAIVTRYRRPLLRYCSRILTEERAEDAVQQTFVRAYGAMRKNSAALTLRPWLYRIAHNTALNALRDRGLRHEELTDQLDGVERPDEALERAQGLREVVSAVQDLPERQRDAIVLRELEGRSYDEIAEELGVTDGAVRQLLNRARNTLRDAATSLTPVGLALRLPWDRAADSIAVRVAELCGVGGGGALAAKVCATALVTGAVVGGGVAVGPDVLPGESARGDQTVRRDRGVADDVRRPAHRPAAPSVSAPATGGVTRRRAEDRSADRAEAGAAIRAAAAPAARAAAGPGRAGATAAATATRAAAGRAGADPGPAAAIATQAGPDPADRAPAGQAPAAAAPDRADRGPAGQAPAGLARTPVEAAPAAPGAADPAPAATIRTTAAAAPIRADRGPAGRAPRTTWRTRAAPDRQAASSSGSG